MVIVENWKPVVGYESLYEVSDLGRVKSLAKTLPHANYGSRRWPEKILKDADNGTGHRVVNLWKGKRRRKAFVHRLVLEAFVGTCPPKYEACHINDDPKDNRLANLYWGTRSDNLNDMVRNGKNHNASKVSCKRGHPLTLDNLVPSSLRDGRRDCRRCHRARIEEKMEP